VYVALLVSRLWLHILVVSLLICVCRTAREQTVATYIGSVLVDLCMSHCSPTVHSTNVKIRYSKLPRTEQQGTLFFPLHAGSVQYRYLKSKILGTEEVFR
jgi:hypothetical protein